MAWRRACTESLSPLDLISEITRLTNAWSGLSKFTYVQRALIHVDSADDHNTTAKPAATHNAGRRMSVAMAIHESAMKPTPRTPTTLSKRMPVTKERKSSKGASESVTRVARNDCATSLVSS